MFDQLALILSQDCQITSGQTILVGVSGGPDSLCLLDVLHRLGYPLVVAHLDHGLRPEAGADARFVAQIAASYHLPFVVEQARVADFAAENVLSLEEAARHLRYQFLFSQAALCDASAVAVGHSADDQVETVLMHLLRGAGLAGLKGMPVRSLPNPWSQDIPLIRPLLTFWHDEILAYCNHRGLHPVIDGSNYDATFYRNRLRLELIPALEALNPGFRQRLLQTAQILTAEDQSFVQLMDTVWRELVAYEAVDSVALRLEGFLAQSLGIQRRLVRSALAKLRPGLRDIEFETVERALKFTAQSTRSRKLDLAAGMSLALEEGWLWFFFSQQGLPGCGWPQLPSGTALELPVPGQLPVPDGWVLTARLVPGGEEVFHQACTNPDAYTAWVDAHLLSLPLTVRTRLAGDRFQPLGMDGGSLKLADMLINLKMPTRLRKSWPLVCSDDTILWVPGYRLSHLFRVQPETLLVAVLSLTKI